MSFGCPFFLSHWPNGFLRHCSLPKWKNVQEFGAKALLGALAKAGGEASLCHPKATHSHLCRSGRGKPHISTWNGEKKTNPIPETKPHKSFMQSFSLCICSLVSQPECLINRFLFCPPHSSEEHWRVGSALAHPGCLKGSSPGLSAPNLLHFYFPAHRAVGPKIFKNQ